MKISFKKIAATLAAAVVAVASFFSIKSSITKTEPIQTYAENTGDGINFEFDTDVDNYSITMSDYSGFLRFYGNCFVSIYSYGQPYWYVSVSQDTPWGHAVDNSFPDYNCTIIYSIMDTPDADDTYIEVNYSGAFSDFEIYVTYHRFPYGSGGITPEEEQEIFDRGYAAGEEQGWELGRADGYGRGVDDGYLDGVRAAEEMASGDEAARQAAIRDAFERGVDKGHRDEAKVKEEQLDAMYDAGKRDGRDIGYQEGIQDSGKFNFFTLMDAIFGSFFGQFSTMLNFELLGVNIYEFLTALLTIAIVVKIIGFINGMGA